MNPSVLTLMCLCDVYLPVCPSDLHASISVYCRHYGILVHIFLNVNISHVIGLHYGPLCLQPFYHLWILVNSALLIQVYARYQASTELDNNPIISIMCVIEGKHQKHRTVGTDDQGWTPLEWISIINPGPGEPVTCFISLALPTHLIQTEWACKQASDDSIHLNKMCWNKETSHTTYRALELQERIERAILTTIIWVFAALQRVLHLTSKNDRMYCVLTLMIRVKYLNIIWMNKKPTQFAQPLVLISKTTRQWGSLILESLSWIDNKLGRSIYGTVQTISMLFFGSLDLLGHLIAACSYI